MILTKRQKEIIKKLQEGWTLEDRWLGFPQLFYPSGYPSKDVRDMTIDALVGRGLITRPPKDYFDAPTYPIYKLTEKGESL